MNAHQMCFSLGFYPIYKDAVIVQYYFILHMRSIAHAIFPYRHAPNLKINGLHEN